LSHFFFSEGNYTQVRVAAFDALFLTKWYTPKIMRYILAVAAGDSSRTVRRHVARNACQSLALLVSMGELKTSAKESESLLIEEDGSAQDKAKETKKSEVDSLVRTLRKDKEVGKNEMIREFLVPIALLVGLFQPVVIFTHLIQCTRCRPGCTVVYHQISRCPCSWC
jgi:transcription initiation factor TFIID subunit 2